MRLTVERLIVSFRVTTQTDRLPVAHPLCEAGTRELPRPSKTRAKRIEPYGWNTTHE